MDIDIDTRSDFDPLVYFTNWVKASNVIGDKIVAHPVGVYPQFVPVNPLNGLCSIPYNIEINNRFKIDFLHLNIYNFFTSREQIKELLQHEPNYDLLLSPKIVKQLFQLGESFDILQKIKPQSVDDLADTIAIIRPGKIGLLQKYISNKAKYRHLVYKTNDSDEFGYKKSHAYAYALVIKLQLHLIGNGIV